MAKFYTNSLEVANVMHSTPLFQTTTLKNRTHTALWTRAFWVISQMLEAGFHDPSPLPACPHDQTAISWEPAGLDLALGYCRPVWWSVCRFTWEMNMALISPALAQSPAKVNRDQWKQQAQILEDAQSEKKDDADSWATRTATGPLAAVATHLWFLQYLLCHPSNCWLVWNPSPFN